jgi:hypothetical protein
VAATLAILAAAVFAGRAVDARSEDHGPKDVVYNHLKGGATSFVRDLKNGEQIFIVINDTCPTQFEYEVEGFEKETPPPSIRYDFDLSTKKVPLVHDSRYGGYLVHMRKVEGRSACKGGDALVSKTLLISVRDITWDISFTGGFTVSSLTNPVFAIETDPDGTTKRVIEDSEKKDAVNLGIGAFVHVFHQRLPWLAPAFGLGIRSDSKTEYFLGGAVRLSDKAAINAGVAFGPVTRLPAGVDPDDAVTDDNLLTTLPTRTAPGFFVALSYSFLNARSHLDKPFAGGSSEQPVTTPAKSGDEPGASPEATACQVDVVESDRTKLEFGPEAAERSIQLIGSDNCDWNVTWLDQGDKEATKPPWISIELVHEPSRKDGQLTIRVGANHDPGKRTATFKVGSNPIVVTQIGGE